MSIDDQAHEARKWWRDLVPNQTTGQRGNRAALARLRHVTTPLEAAEEPETIDLARRLGCGIAKLDDVAVCAAVLAQVRDDQGGSLARRIGPDPRDGSRRPLVSALRFRRLVHADTPEDRLIQFRRLVGLADRKADVVDLAKALLDWSDQRKREWIFRYYAGEAPTPQSSTEGAAP